MRLLGLVCALAACSTSHELRVDRATPDVGPLAGGTRITLEGDGFTADTRVLIGDREAPLAAASRDGTKLDVVIPPGEHAGPTTVTVLAGSAAATATTAFRYATEPAIATVSPDRVLASTPSHPASPTLVTLTGSGFSDDGAGTVTVLVDGVPATDVTVLDDATLTFVAPDGPALVQPTIELIDDRGTARMQRGFRYVPSLHAGLLLFSNWTGELASFFDVTTREMISIPRTSQQSYRYPSVFVDGRGDYWAIDRALRFGRLDLRTGTLVDPRSLTSVFPAMTLVNGRIFAIDRYTLHIGTLDASTGVFSQLGTATVGCCGSFGIAGDGATIYVTSRSGSTTILQTLDADTGTLGSPVTLQGSAGFRVEELRVLDHVLYATSGDSTLCTIDPATGAVSIVTYINRSSAMEVLP